MSQPMMEGQGWSVRMLAVRARVRVRASRRVRVGGMIRWVYIKSILCCCCCWTYS